MAKDDVRIEIEVDTGNSIAELEAVRRKLKQLNDDHDRLNKTYERHRRQIQEVTKENKRLSRDNDMLGNSLRRSGGAAGKAASRYANFAKKVFDLRGDIGKMIGVLGKFIGLMGKLAMFEIPAFAAGMAGIAALFKTGTFFAKMYNAAMSSLAYGVGAIAVALTTAVAAAREFQSVQFGPMYAKGAENTTNRFVAASQAMSMFVDSSRLASVASADLSKAFGILSKQAPVTGKTTAAFEGLMNVVAGSGGDLGKGAQNLATFIAKVQKSGLQGAGQEAKALGPDFEMIIKEARALGIDTQEEFFKAAAEGTLGKTFQEKYAGQLDALNETLFGRFKAAFVEIKTLLSDIGNTFLEPVGQMVKQMSVTIRRGIMQIAPLIKGFGTNSLFGDIIRLTDTVVNKIVYLMNRYLNNGPGLFSFFKDVIGAIGRTFERLQDWSRQFEEAGNVIIENFIKPVWDGLSQYFGGGMHTLAGLVEENGPQLQKFAEAVVELLKAIGEFSNMIKEAFVAALPALGVFLKVISKIFQVFTKVANFFMDIFGSLGSAGKVLAAIPVLYASLVLFRRFFTTFGGMFGKDMTVKARNVNVYGPGAGPGGTYGGGQSAFGPGSSSPPGTRWADRMRNSPLGQARGVYGNMRGYGAGRTDAFRAAAKGYSINPGSRLGFLNNRFGLGNMGAMMLASGAMAYGSSIGGTKGAVISGAGEVANTAMMAKMMGASPLGTAALASGVGAYKAADISTNMIQDMSGGKLGRDDTMGKLGLAAAGAGTGAATGAAIGAVIGGPIGAGVGAVIGTVVGGIKGYLNAGKFQKEARDAASGMVDKYTEEVEKAFAAGDLDALTKARDELQATHAANLQNITDQATYQEEMAKYAEELAEVDKQIKTYSDNINMAERALNTNSDAMNRLAKTAGIDLTREMLTFADMVKLVGKTSVEQSNLIKAAWSQISGGVLQGALGRIQQYRQGQQAATAAQATEQQILSGGATDEVMLQMIENTLGVATSRYGELGGIAATRSTLMADLAPGGRFAGVLTPEQIQTFTGFIDMVTGADAIMAALTPEQKQMLTDITSSSGLSQTQVLDVVGTKMRNGDDAFLANLEAASRSQNWEMVNKMLGVKGVPGPQTATAPAAGGGGGATTNQFAVDVQIEGTIDPNNPNTQKAIATAVAKAIQDAQERGATTTTTTGR
jgi:hypothetical protein